jgi:hypothetical protein
MERHNLLHVELPEGPFDEAIAMIQATMDFAKPSELSEALTEITMVCRARDKSVHDTTAWFAIVLKTLADQPRDAILDACSEWLKKSPFLPAPSELIDMAKGFDSPRSNLLYVLKASKFDHKMKKPPVYPALQT